jgi:hypothetical protein
MDWIQSHKLSGTTRKERMKMKRSVLSVMTGIMILTFLTSGCVYMKVQRPHDKDYALTELGDKVGKSELKSFLWLFAWGDAGTKAAAENGGIKVIKHADVEYYVIMLGLYTRITTVLYGD